MADRNALGTLGLMLATATVFVMMIGGAVVTSHLTGRLQIDERVNTLTLSAAAR